MDKGYESIEALLTSLKVAHRGIEREIQNLYNNCVDEEDTLALTDAAAKLFEHNLLLQEFILLTLSDEWDARKTREAISKQKLFLVLQRKAPDEERDIMDWFADKLEEKIKQAPPPYAS